MLPRRYLPSIASLLALEALDRLGTASAVADELSLTQGAVSRQLQTLEGQLGVELIRRERQRLELTPAARDYVVEVRKSLKTLAEASLTLRANPAGGALNLAILPAFGMHWLAPRLARFSAAHPGVTVNLSTRLRPFDFSQTAFDAAIHYGREDVRPDWPGVSFMKIMDEDVIAVAAPGHVTGHVAGLGHAQGQLVQARDIMGFTLLQLDSRTGDWGRWLAHHGVPGQRPPAMLFDQFATMTQAAVHGLGIALLPSFLIRAELADGRLVPVYGEAVPALGAYHLVWPEERRPRAPLISFQDWLAGEI